MGKGQAALEFIMTYGWAIMVVMVMIGALAYFGVTNPQSYLPEKCTVSQEFGCVDFTLTQWTEESSSNDIDDGECKLTLRNNLGKTVIIENITFTYKDITTTGVFSFTTNPADDVFSTTLGAGKNANVQCNPREWRAFIFNGVGQQEKITFEISYRKTDGAFSHKVNGEILAIVQEQSDQIDD